MEFTQEQMPEIISSLTNGNDRSQELIPLGMESLMKSQREIYNSQTNDVSNVFCDCRVCHVGQMFKIHIPAIMKATFILFC